MQAGKRNTARALDVAAEELEARSAEVPPPVAAAVVPVPKQTASNISLRCSPRGGVPRSVTATEDGAAASFVDPAAKVLDDGASVVQFSAAGRLSPCAAPVAGALLGMVNGQRALHAARVDDSVVATPDVREVPALPVDLVGLGRAVARVASGCGLERAGAGVAGAD